MEYGHIYACDSWTGLIRAAGIAALVSFNLNIAWRIFMSVCGETFSMQSIKECACTKAILCGEHFVVHGERAIAIPAKPKNCADLSEWGSENSLKIIGRSGEAVFTSEGTISGQEALQSFAPIYFEILRMAKTASHQGLEIKLGYSGAPKGMGNSASLACAIAKALAGYFGVKLSRQQLFSLVQLSEKVAHSNPSGIDAKTVVEEKPQLFRRGMGSSLPEFAPILVRLPKDSSLIIIDTSGGNGSSAKTSELVEKFTRYLVGNKKEKSLRNSYRKILSSFISELRKESPDPEVLGNLMDENHALLREGGVSSYSIEHAIAILTSAGPKIWGAKRKGRLGAKSQKRVAQGGLVYGAKLTGAGGDGGAVLALIKKRGFPEIKKKLGQAGFRVLALF